MHRAALLVSVITCVLAGQDPEVVRRLKADIAWLAGPETLGRGHGQEGLEKAARFLEGRHRALKLAPTVQRFRAKGLPQVTRHEVRLAGKALAWGSEVAASIGGEADLRGVPAVWLGVGRELPASVEGKVVVLMEGDAALQARLLPEGRRGLSARAQEVARLKPAALVLVPRDTASALARLATFGVAGAKSLPVLILSESALRSRFPGLAEGAATQDLGPADLRLAHAQGEVEIPNVVSVIPGTDPKLKEEYLVLSAHFDHLGTTGYTSRARAEDRQKPHHGADDNASGTAVVLDLARRIAAQPLRRSVVVLHVSGEEVGLLGSQHWVEHPTVPLPNIRFVFNFDMVGRLDPRRPRVEIGTVGLRPQAVARLDAHVPRDLPVSHDLGILLMASDHAPFAFKKIPVSFYTTGDHPDYHTHQDVPERIDHAGAARVEDAAYGAIREFGNADALELADPAEFQKLLPEPAKATKAALGAVGGDEEARGLILDEVKAGSTAAELGLKAGDVIASLDGTPIRALYDLNTFLSTRSAGDRVKVVWYRGAQRMEGEAVLKGR